MKRILLGIIAIGMLLAWAVLYFGGYDDNTSVTTASVCLRAGLVLGALSLALPQVILLLARVPLWMMGCMGVGMLAIIRWPRSAVYVVPGMMALWALRPRPANRGTASQRAGKRVAAASNRATTKRAAGTRGAGRKAASGKARLQQTGTPTAGKGAASGDPTSRDPASRVPDSGGSASGGPARQTGRN